MTSVLDVAAYILRKLGPMSTMKLQKLCYYAQGWSLAWDEEPLFNEKIEAWANGPVVRELYRHHRGWFRVSPDEWKYGNPDQLTASQAETVDMVIESYGEFSGQQLSVMTHDESPWQEARRGLSPTDRSSVEVSLDNMQVHFGALALAMQDDPWLP